MDYKQKMGTALGAYGGCESHVRLDAPGLSPLFCGFDTHARKNRGQFRRRAFTATNRSRIKSGTHYSLRNYLELRREQSPFFLRIGTKRNRAITLLHGGRSEYQES